MYKCPVAACPGGPVREDTFDDAHQLSNGMHVLVYGVPVIVCVNCGELSFSAHDTEKVRAMLYDDEQKPTKRVTIPAIEFSRLEPTAKDLLLTTNN